jgi:hypothetical protein
MSNLIPQIIFSQGHVMVMKKNLKLHLADLS